MELQFFEFLYGEQRIQTCASNLEDAHYIALQLCGTRADPLTYLPNANPAESLGEIDLTNGATIH